MRTALLLLLLLPLGAAVVQAQDEAAALFRSHCANCHNSNGNGKTAAGEKMKIPDLRAPQVQGMSDEQLFQTIANGAHHKQYPHTFLRKGMREAQIRGLVAHIRTLKTSN
jgi:mono/diheme cytochrome c family protein